MPRPTPVLAAAAALVLALGVAACGGDDDDGGAGTISNEGNEELFTTDGFQEAYDAVEEQTGPDAAVLQVQITQAGGADFKLLGGEGDDDGEGVSGLIYTGGELVGEEVEIIGSGSLEGRDFPFSEIEPGAIDAIADGVAEQNPEPGIAITSMTLERRPEGELSWTASVTGAGAGLVYAAAPDGSELTPVTRGGAGAPAQ
jgi:hypothetical protein